MIAPIAWAVVEGGPVIARQGDVRAVPWWSFGKTVLAAAALKLVESGALALDARIGDAPYTLRQVLQHRAGVPDYGGLRDYHAAVARKDAPWDLATLRALADADRPLFTPGARFAYSNIAYREVADRIAAAAYLPLSEALQALVFAPAGVRAGLARREPPTPYLPEGYDPGWVYHGLVAGTVDDAALLLDAIIGGRVLGSELTREMQVLIPLGFPTPGRPVSIVGSGMGLFGELDPASRYIVGHTGAGPGSSIVTWCDRRRTIAMFFAGDGLDDGEIEREALRRMDL